MNILLISSAALGAALALSGCATKSYPITAPLSPTEAQMMNCRELAFEMDRIDSTRSQVANTARTNWRSVAGFMIDYGIGNVIAKNEADAALANRSEQVRQAQAGRGCIGPNDPAAPAPALSPAQ